MDISITIPVYNASDHIEKCLDSIFNQKFNGSLEVVAVDDNSTDNSFSLLETYSKNESRLKVFKHQENKKQSIARATALLHSSGKYILNIDADDWLLPNMLQIIFNKIKNSDSDVLAFNHFIEKSDGKKIINKTIKKEFITYNKNIVLKDFVGNIWDKLIKRNLVEELLIHKETIQSGEDLLYSLEILLKANKFYMCKELVYVYKLNKNSITHKINNYEMIQSRIQLIQILNKIDKKYLIDPFIYNFIIHKTLKTVYIFSFFILLSRQSPDKKLTELYNILNSSNKVDHNILIKIKRTKNLFYSFLYTIKYNDIKENIYLMKQIFANFSIKLFFRWKKYA